MEVHESQTAPKAEPGPKWGTDGQNGRGSSASSQARRQRRLKQPLGVPGPSLQPPHHPQSKSKKDFSLCCSYVSTPHMASTPSPPRKALGGPTAVHALLRGKKATVWFSSLWKFFLFSENSAAAAYSQTHFLKKKRTTDQRENVSAAIFQDGLGDQQLVIVEIKEKSVASAAAIFVFC